MHSVAQMILMGRASFPVTSAGSAAKPVIITMNRSTGENHHLAAGAFGYLLEPIRVEIAMTALGLMSGRTREIQEI